MPAKAAKETKASKEAEASTETKATMPTKAPKETKPSDGTKTPKKTNASKEAKAARETKSSEGTQAPKAGKAHSAKAEPASPGGRKPNALQKPLRPSRELAAVVGSEPLPRGEVVSKVWEYIKTHDLQNPQNRREILADDALEAVFGRKKVTMFEMNKYLAQHLASPEEE